jgi:protein-arginine kinase activator protein McsA
LGVRLTAKVGAPEHVGKIPTERTDSTNNRRRIEERKKKKRQKRKRNDQTPENQK